MKSLWWVAASLGLFVSSSMALSLGQLPPHAQTCAATLEHDYVTKIRPFFGSAESGTFKGKDGAEIFYRKFVHEPEQEKGAVVLVTGWTETSQKYAELMFNFYAMGYSIYAMDNRGQGLSQRLSPNPLMVHVENFSDYVFDLKKFMDTVVKKRPHKKTFILAHSTGGLISALFAAKYPWDINGVVCSAPLFRINTGHFSESIAHVITSTSIAMGGDMHYVLTHGDEKPEQHLNFAKQQATHSEPRHKVKTAIWSEEPRSFMSGSSNRWLQRGLEATWWLHDEAPSLDVPFLVFTADQDDRVWNPGMAETCRRMKSCKNYVLKNSYHEIFIEADPLRDFVVDETLKFFERE